MVESALLQNRYRLSKRLAAGGMGTVWVAMDERLDRRVAIKLLKDELAQDPLFVERFRREARAVAALSHPNVAAVYDYGEEGDRPFIVMELVEGRDLAHVLREEGPLDTQRTVAIGVQICEGLAHAHAAGVVHRDVKPANVIVGPRDSVKVTDFGIARAAGDSKLTATGSMLGTAHYLSPEQASGDKIGPASDIYSAGIVVYEMLTGTVPFTGDSPVGVAMRHVSETVPVPGSLKSDVPPALDTAIARATAKNPSDRFQDAADMAAALRNSLEPIDHDTAPAPTVWPIPGDRWDPRRLGRAVVLTLAALAVLAASLATWRILTKDDDARAQSDRNVLPPGVITGSSPAATTPSPEIQPAFVVPSMVGDNYKDWEKSLLDEGLLVHIEEVEVDEDEGVDKHEIVDTNPPPGSTVEVGDTITLFVADEVKKDKDEEEEDD